MSEKRYDGGHYAAIGDFVRENYLREGFAQGTVQEVDFLVGELELPTNAHILDVGCGAGRHALEFARRGFRPLGVDLSKGLIGVARDLATTEGLAAEFVVGDARALTFSQEFDAAVCLCQGAFGLAGGRGGTSADFGGAWPARFVQAPPSSSPPSTRSRFSAVTTRGASTSTPTRSRRFLPRPFTARRGETLQTDVHVTAFTYRELKWLLEAAGFEVVARLRLRGWQVRAQAAHAPRCRNHDGCQATLNRPAELESRETQRLPFLSRGSSTGP